MKFMQEVRGAAWRVAARTMAALTVLVLAVGCATGVVMHAFSFDTRDEPGVEILDYVYGDSQQPGARANPFDVANGARIAQNVNINGEIRRPKLLYVRWRDLHSGKVYEDTVNLERLLPRDIADHRIHFIARGAQLFVYLISPERRNPKDPALGPLEYQYRKVIALAADVGREVTDK